jgi:hypothetical protein
VELESLAGGRALLLRVDNLFGWAQRDAVGTVELSLGSITDGDWTITDSALPYREQQTLGPRRGSPRSKGKELHTNDIDAQGTPITQKWLVRYTEGNVTL